MAADQARSKVLKEESNRDKVKETWSLLMLEAVKGLMNRLLVVFGWHESASC